MRRSTTLHGIRLEVDIDYQPPEDQTFNYPGADEDVFVDAVLHQDEDISDLLSPDTILMLANQVMREMKEEWLQDQADERMAAQFRF